MALITRPMIGAPSMRTIVATASRITSIPIEQLTSNNRWKELVAVRSAIAQIGRRYGYSTTQIGLAICREHTTVSHAMSNDGADVVAVLDALDKTLRGDVAVVDPDRFAPPSDALVKARKDAPLVTTASRPRVAPFPPGADAMILRGTSRKKLREMWPEWRV